MIRRVVLFVLTNLAILVVLGFVMNILYATGVVGTPGHGGIDFGSLFVMAAVFGFGGSFISLAMSKMIAKWSTGARVIKQPSSETEAWLVSTVQRHAQQAGIGMPEVAIYESPDMNAFATGARRDAALVAVSTGLLRNMRPEEVDGVLAHEVAHVANGDMVTLTLIQGVVNTFVIFASRVVGYVVDRTIFRSEDRQGHGPGFYITTIVAQIFLGILASMIVMWFSRQREYRADAGGAQLAGKTKMVNALERLRRDQGPADLPDSMAAFGIRGGKPSGIRALFMSHPPLEERIARLQAMQVA